MRQERTVQASIFDQYAPHEIGHELQAMSAWLDAHPELLSWVTADLRVRPTQPTGRCGISGESVLRCAILKQYRQLSYEDLAFCLLDSMSCQAFARLTIRDRDRLLELFFNLLENAIRYAPGSQVTVGGELAGQVARVWVEDSGPGISPEHLPHIFERFYRVDPARNRANHGSGLGLAIAQEIAHLHGGRLSVHSEPGKGTTFVVELS